ncbi:MAG: DNA topoisomerase VI subunit B [archaeon]
MTQTTLTGKNNLVRAEELALKQREISISEFFTKNRHLLGFDNPRKALLTTIKEAVDNALDACEEMNVLPDIFVEIKKTNHEDRFIIIIEDNGPGIVKSQLSKIFGKLLYGSKFHKLSQTRGQQGIGISASVLYGQLTTGKATKIISKIGKNQDANMVEIHLNTKTNNPEIVQEEIIAWDKDHGTRVEIELEGKFHKGKLSVEEYIKQSAISNPHATFTLISPDEEKIVFPRATQEIPKEPKEIKPHPYGIELGMLIRMLKETTAKTLLSFLQTEFSRVSSKVAKEICEKASLYPNARPTRIARQEADILYKSIQETKIMAPPTDCVSPIGEEQLLQGLMKEVDAEFYVATTRPPSVYRGNPFVIEVAVAYGGSLVADALAKLVRFANRVPLQHQQGACSITKSVMQTSWKKYGLQQSRGALPSGPLIIIVHMASVWVPFTSESKEAIASYPEITKEMKLALQECGRKLSIELSKKRKVSEESKKVSYIEKYLPHIGIGLKEILNLSEDDEKNMLTILKDILERSRK